MSKPELIELIKLISALESWSYSTGLRIPDYLLDKIEANIKVLEREVLSENA